MKKRDRLDLEALRGTLDPSAAGIRTETPGDRAIVRKTVASSEADAKRPIPTGGLFAAAGLTRDAVRNIPRKP